MNKEKKEKRVKENEKEKEKENICKCLMSAAENAWSWVPCPQLSKWRRARTIYVSALSAANIYKCNLFIYLIPIKIERIAHDVAVRSRCKVQQQTRSVTPPATRSSKNSNFTIGAPIVKQTVDCKVYIASSWLVNHRSPDSHCDVMAKQSNCADFRCITTHCPGDDRIAF